MHEAFHIILVVALMTIGGSRALAGGAPRTNPYSILTDKELKMKLQRIEEAVADRKFNPDDPGFQMLQDARDEIAARQKAALSADSAFRKKFPKDPPPETETPSGTEVEKPTGDRPLKEPFTPPAADATGPRTPSVAVKPPPKTDPKPDAARTETGRPDLPPLVTGNTPPTGPAGDNPDLQIFDPLRDRDRAGDGLAADPTASGKNPGGGREPASSNAEDDRQPLPSGTGKPAPTLVDTRAQRVVAAQTPEEAVAAPDGHGAVLAANAAPVTDESPSAPKAAPQAAPVSKNGAGGPSLDEAHPDRITDEQIQQTMRNYSRYLEAKGGSDLNAKREVIIERLTTLARSLEDPEEKAKLLAEIDRISLLSASDAVEGGGGQASEALGKGRGLSSLQSAAALGAFSIQAAGVGGGSYRNAKAGGGDLGAPSAGIFRLTSDKVKRLARAMLKLLREGMGSGGQRRALANAGAHGAGTAASRFRLPTMLAGLMSRWTGGSDASGGRDPQSEEDIAEAGAILFVAFLLAGAGNVAAIMLLIRRRRNRAARRAS